MRGLMGHLILAALVGSASIGQGSGKIVRQDRDKILTRQAQELSAPQGVDLATAEVDAMSAFSDTRGLANIGCQYATETIIILDNSSAIFDKELWMFKLLIKEIAAAFLRVNTNSRFGLILNTRANEPVVYPMGPNGQNVTAIWQAVKAIQRDSSANIGNLVTATQNAIRMFNLNVIPVERTYNLIVLTSPYTTLTTQLGEAAALFGDTSKVRRFLVGTRITERLTQAAMEVYTGVPGSGHVQYVSMCTPARFLFLLKRLYPLLCVPCMYYREAAIMTFQIDGLPVDDDNASEFVDKFLDVMSQTTGVEREYLEVIDIRDSNSSGGPQYNARRLSTMETLVDHPQDTLLDIVVRDSPTGLRDTPFRIAGKLDSDLRNDLSPVASLFETELRGIPRVRKIAQPRDTIFSRPSNGLTFQKLYLGDGFGSGLASGFGDRVPLGELLQQ